MKKLNIYIGWLIVFSILLGACAPSVEFAPEQTADPSSFRIVAGPELKLLEDAGIFAEFSKTTDGFPVTLNYLGSVDIKLKALGYAKNDPKDVDGWIAASPIWLPSFVTSSAYFMRTVTVFAVDRKVASELGWDAQTGITMTDIISGIQRGNIHLAMPSASQDDAGAIAYLAAWSAVADGPETLRISDLSDQVLVDQMTTLFSSVERSSSRSDELRTMFVNDRISGNSQMNAVFMAEAEVLAIEKDLVAHNAEPLQIFYVKDAVGMQTFPFGYSKSASPEKQAQFAALLKYLQSEAVQAKIQSLGFRTGYVGMRINTADTAVFNPDWGVITDTDFVLIDLPKDTVIDQALVLYQTTLRNGSYTVYTLDFSPSMNGDGMQQLLTAMELLLDQSKASVYTLQASPKDTTTAILFSGSIMEEWQVQGNDSANLLTLYDMIKRRELGSATNIYGSVIRALLYAQQQTRADQLPAVILLTDGAHNTGEGFGDLQRFYQDNNLTIPVYSIMMGDADSSELKRIAELTNGSVCDGRRGVDALVQCFLQYKGN